MEINQHSLSLANVPLPDEDEFELLTIEEQILIEDCIAYTEEATCVPSGVEFISRLICTHEDDNNVMCQGNVLIVRYDNPPQIKWECMKCGKTGSILDFEDTQHDLRHLSVSDAEKYLHEKYVVPYQYGLGDEGVMPDQTDLDFLEWMKKLSPKDKETVLNNLQDEIFDKLGKLQEQMGGLDFIEFQHLLEQNWNEEDGIIRFNNRLSLDEVNQSFFFHGAREFLKTIQEQGHFELTRQKYLKRKHVDVLVERINWPNGYIARVKSVNKVLNEVDVWLLHVIRVLLDLSGLIRIHKGVFKPVRKRAHLSRKVDAGKLFKHLFICYFRTMNISYLTNQQEFSLLQESVPYILLQLQQIADDWTSLSELIQQIMLVGVRQELEMNLSKYEKEESIINHLILKPLVYFGLLEAKYSKKPKYDYIAPDQYRKTELFDRFIQFKTNSFNFKPGSE